ncbi:Thiol-disulfide oxidoreductase ResA [Alphaproteobacteria bacterium SO-S41]|nr:Thiol-disulfide oxidoreductase ResA [Alphaproteobacteria bacterium SO-S41]
MPWKIAALAGVLLGLCVAALVFTMRDGGEASQPALEVTSPQTQAPGGKAFFTFPADEAAPFKAAFRDGKGAEVTLDSFKGRPVLINFWATWCAPCVNELPSLARLHDKLGDQGPLILILNLDRENGPSIPDFLAEHDVTGLEPYTDPAKKLMRGFRINGLPTTILLDAEGKEIARREGEAEWDGDLARAEIDKALASAK